MYNKLFTKILDSSIWLEPLGTRIVWITLIATMDEDGYCHFSAIENLARRAGVSLEECNAAVTVLLSPDINSGDPEHEGRRIERVPGGFMVLNSEKHRDAVTREKRREQTKNRVKKYRERHSNNRNVTQCNENVTPSVSVSESISVSNKEEEHKTTKKGSIISEEEFLATLKGSPAYSHVNVPVEISKMDMWLLAHPGRKKTRKFVTSWLNRIEVPLQSNGHKSINDSWKEFANKKS